MNDSLRTIYNGSAISLTEIPVVDSRQFLQSILDAADHGWRVVSYFGIPAVADVSLFCVRANKAEGRLAVTRTVADGNTFPSIASLSPQVQLFEREMAEQCGLIFEGHPWFKPVRFHRPFLPGRVATEQQVVDLRHGCCFASFLDHEGAELLQVAPVRRQGMGRDAAFRFQVGKKCGQCLLHDATRPAARQGRRF